MCKKYVETKKQYDVVLRIKKPIVYKTKFIVYYSKAEMLA